MLTPSQYGGIPRSIIQELYEDDREVFEQIQELLAEDWGVLERHGIALEGIQVFPILLGLKADWSFHVSWKQPGGYVFSSEYSFSAASF